MISAIYIRQQLVAQTGPCSITKLKIPNSIYRDFEFHRLKIVITRLSHHNTCLVPRMEVIPVLRITWIILNLFIVGLSTFSQNGYSSQCPDGFFYNATDHEDDSSSCTPCTVCPVGSEIVTSCTNQSDTICRPCDPGTFSSGRFKCENCSHCPPGTYVADYCRVTSNTRCEPCAEGMYSTEWSMRRCSRCSRCNRLMTTLANCSKTENYKCGDCIEGYYKHPNLPMCIRCAYCYPDNPGATVLVDECISKSADPNMRCMPIAGVPQLVGFAGYGGSNSPMTTSMSATTTYEAAIISSFGTPQSDSALIPPHISIPIIVTFVSITVLFLVTILIYKRRTCYKKTKWASPIFTISPFTRKFKTSDNDRKRNSDSSNEVVMVHSIADNTESSSSGCTPCEQTTFVQSHNEDANTSITLTPEVTNPDAHVIIGDNQSPVTDKETIPVTDVKNTGTSNVTNQMTVAERAQLKRPHVKDDNNCDSGVNRVAYCAENEAFEEEEESSMGAFLPKESATSGDDITGKPVITKAAVHPVTDEITEDDYVSQLSGRLLKRRKVDDGETNPGPPELLHISVLPRNNFGPGTDSEDSSAYSSRSAMSSDYDSDAVISNTLLDSGRALEASTGPRQGAPDGQAKKKKRRSRRQSDQGMCGHKNSAKQLYSKIGTFSV